MSEYIDGKSLFLKEVGHFGPKLQVEGDIPTILRVRKLDASSYHMVLRCGQKLVSFCHNSRV